ncbi:MAG: zinc ribbon domain-containing protein [Micromonosporaceae bacterium]
MTGSTRGSHCVDQGVRDTTLRRDTNQSLDHAEESLDQHKLARQDAESASTPAESTVGQAAQSAVGQVAPPAVGRVAVADPCLLRGLLVCARCQRLMLPVYNPRAGRGYSCGPGCAQPDLPAHEVEADLLLAALITAYTRVLVNTEGKLRPHWRRCDDTTHAPVTEPRRGG